MSIRGTLGLALVLAVLASYLAFTRPAPGPATDGPNRLMPALGDATQLELTQGDRVITVARHDGTWERPGVADALDTLASLEVLGVIDAAPSDPAAYGFGADAMRLRVSRDGRTVADVDVGAMNPAGTGVYVRRHGEPAVLLVGALFHWELEKVRRVASETGAP